MAHQPIEPNADLSQTDAITNKISSFDYNNPLGVSTPLFWIVRIYTPFLSIVIPLFAGFSIWVFKSKFLRDLVCEPIFTQLFAINIMLALVGPGYIAVFQEYSYYLTTEHGHSCNLLLWMHNFALIASPWTFILLLLERAVAINRQDDMAWVRFKVMSTKASVCLLVLILPISIIGVLCSDVTGSYTLQTYPVCNPWWQNEYTSAGPVWFKVVAVLFSLAPSQAMVIAMVILALVTKRYKRMVRCSQDNLGYFTGLYLGLRARCRLQFVRSVLCLGGLFLLTVLPLGLFILVGPAVQARRLYGTQPPPPGPSTSPNGTAARGSPSVGDSYLLSSRTDVEVVMWLLCYTWTLLVVPVLLLSEILFRREFKGRVHKLGRCVCCKSHPKEVMINIGELWDRSSEDGQTRDDIYVTTYGRPNFFELEQLQHRCVLDCRQGCCPCVDPRTACSQQCSPPLADRAGGVCPSMLLEPPRWYPAKYTLRRAEDGSEGGAAQYSRPNNVEQEYHDAFRHRFDY